MTPCTVLLVAMLGSPDYQAREGAATSLEALTYYNHPVLLAGTQAADQEISNRCADIQTRHRAAIFRRLQTVRWKGSDIRIGFLPGLEFLSWNPERKTLYYTVWMAHLFANTGHRYEAATRVYLDYLLDQPGATEASLRALVKHLHGQRQHALDYWARQRECYDYENEEAQGPLVMPPPRPKP
jgi:hypothetical protein